MNVRTKEKNKLLIYMSQSNLRKRIINIESTNMLYKINKWKNILIKTDEKPFCW